MAFWSFWCRSGSGSEFGDPCLWQMDPEVKIRHKAVGIKVFLFFFAYWKKDPDTEPDPDPYVRLIDPDPDSDPQHWKKPMEMWNIVKFGNHLGLWFFCIFSLYWFSPALLWKTGRKWLLLQPTETPYKIGYIWEFRDQGSGMPIFSYTYSIYKYVPTFQYILCTLSMYRHQKAHVKLLHPPFVIL